MNPLIHAKRATLICFVALACFGLSPVAHSQCPTDCDATGNTAIGIGALQNNTTGVQNTAVGADSLFRNSAGFDNTANGNNALTSNTTGSNNTATGSGALVNNNANNNTAVGADSLFRNTAGLENTAMGGRALFSNTSGNFNTAVGFNALSNATGLKNVAIGHQAGIKVTTGSNNIDIGAPGGDGDSQTIRIGSPGSQNSTFIAGISGNPMAGSLVVVNRSGKLGVTTSSARFKDEIKPMNEASDTLMELKPVTFRYKKQIDPDGIPQFGLVAEEVEKLNPDLVVRDKEGKPFSVRYDAVNAMLLNEFLKEHRKVEQMEKQIEKLTAGLQKVSAQIKLSKSAPQTVLNNH